MRELPALEGDYDEPTTSRPRSPTRYNIEKNFDKVDLELLEIMGYRRPNNFFGTDIDRLEEIHKELLNKMEERAIHISSINREKRGTSKPGDFTIKFNPSLKLDPDKTHQLALDRLSMTYSWYNIRSDYGNNKIKYTHDGTNWQTITFTDGMYSYSDINDYIHQYMSQKSHHTTDSVLISLDGVYQLDLRGTEFGDLIGFEKKLITKTEYGSKLPNITNSIDVLNINTSAITDSIVNGINTNTIAVIPTDNLTRNPKYLDRYEDVVFDLEQTLDAAPANNAHQTKTGLRFVADNTGESTPFDWYNARLSMDFKVNKLADGGNIAVADHNGIVNGSNSFIEKLSILANGREVYSCNYANHVVNIKNLLEYNPSYAQSVATN
ncbi:unnamed protein product, partial [Porites lobata]